MGAHDLDLHAWAREQADALRRRSANELDWDKVAEEIENLVGQQQWELYNRLVVLLTHLLKWAYQPSHRSRSWRATLAIQRREITKLVRRSPSLKSVQNAEFVEAYGTSRLKAETETGLALPTFPLDPPFTLDQALDPDWTPDGDGDQSSTGSNGS